MGIMPGYDPFRDAALQWAVVGVNSCEPRVPTWRHPGVVTLTVESVLRGIIPPQVSVLFDAPREAEQARFYAMRDAAPEVAARQLAELDERRIEVPELGSRVVVWLCPPVTPVAPEGDLWTIPTLRQFSPNGLPMHVRWIEHSAPVEAAVRQRLGV